MSHLPTIADVLKVRDILRNPIHGSYLPLEIIDLIIDHASYWPHTTAEAHSLVARGGAPESASNTLCLRTWPLGAQELDDVMIPNRLDTIDSKWWDWRSWAAKLGLTTKASDQKKDKPTWVPPRGTHPCRKIVFELESHDQGWSGERIGKGTYDNSYTWFDAGIETAIFWPSVLTKQEDTPAELDGRLQTVGPSIPWLTGYDPTKSPCYSPEGYAVHYERQLAESEPLHPFLPPLTRVQSNLHAHGKTKAHTVTWSYTDCIGADCPEADEAAAMGRGKETLDGAFVRRLRTGDCVTLWARARFPGWRNTVENAKVQVYWAV